MKVKDGVVNKMLMVLQKRKRRGDMCISFLSLWSGKTQSNEKREITCYACDVYHLRRSKCPMKGESQGGFKGAKLKVDPLGSTAITNFNMLQLRITDLVRLRKVPSTGIVEDMRLV